MSVRSNPPAGLAHAAYLEALANAEEGTEEWHLLAAGHATLWLFEAWGGCDGGAMAPAALEIRRVRKRVEAVGSHHPVRRCLSQLVDLVERSPVGRGGEGAPGLEAGRILAAYARLLQYDARWPLAVDVHQTLLRQARCVDDEERMLDSMLMLGFSYRMMGRLGEAYDAYVALREAAARAGDERHRLLSELGLAKMAIERGNLPLASAMLDRLIDETRGRDAVVLAKALSDRARVAGQMGDFSTSLALNFEAMSLSRDALDRDRIMADLALAFAYMGLRDQARDANLVLSATAQDATQRFAAKNNLMELAYLDGRETVFEQYRRELARVPLTPYLLATHHEVVGHGCRAFDRHDEAREAFQRMLAVAERHGLNELAMKAADALEEMVRSTRAAPPTPHATLDAQPSDVVKVGKAIAALRLQTITSGGEEGHTSHGERGRD